MNKSIRSIAWFIGVLFAGCVSDIDIQPPVNSQVVVNCLLTYDDVQTLRLTYSSALNKFAHTEVPDAKIILHGNAEVIGTFHKSGYGEWQLHYQPEPDMNYSLQIFIEGREPVSAQTTMPKYPLIRKSTDRTNTHTEKYFDQRDDGVYWMFAFQKHKDTLMLQPAVMKEFRLIDEIGTDHERADHFNIIDSDQHHLSTEMHFAYLRIGAGASATFKVEGSLYNSLIVCRSVSASYDAYMKSSLEKMQVYHSFGDPTQWFDESKVYSNIEHGTGVFGAYAEKYFDFNPNDL